MPKKLVLVCLLNFFIAAVFGLLLRYAFVQPMEFNYRFLTHAHSHVAMLGWVYLMLFTLIIHYFIPNKKPIYNRLFWITEFAVVGMLFSFPFQGYAAVSIAFSTLHIFCSYYFAYLIFKHHKTDNKVTSHLLKWALAFMLISTIGVWCLGPAVAMLGQASAFYQIAIQFFLHFQFNGWFLLAVIAVFFHKLQLQDSKKFRLFFKFLIIATILTFAMSVNWFAPHSVLLWINVIGVICQLIALFYFVVIVKSPLKTLINKQATITKYMYVFALVCFVFKIVLQSASLIPEISNVAYQHRNFVIGFIHLTMLGVISGFLFAFLLQTSLIKHSKTLTFGIYAFILGFVSTELILLIQGGFFYFGIGLLPNYYLILFLCSILLPLGIGCFIYNILNTKKMSQKPLKRHKSLQPLSREHHHGLLLSWKIRTGFSKNIEPERIKIYADWFFKTHLIPHFEMEEKYVFSVLEPNNEFVKKALADHKLLRRLFADDHIEMALSKIEEVLDAHIRFEERVLFPEIQKVATELQLLEIEKIHQETNFEDKIDDEFWK